MRLDLNKRLWSLDLNGENWVKETAFPAWLALGENGFWLDNLQFSSRAANGDAPDAVFALANLQLTRMDAR